jgi:hypothetical protein
MRAKLSLNRFQTFFNSSQAIFSRSRVRQRLPCMNFVPNAPANDLMHVTVRPEPAKVFNIGFYFSFWKRRATKPITAVLLLPFAVNWR